MADRIEMREAESRNNYSYLDSAAQEVYSERVSAQVVGKTAPNRDRNGRMRALD